jgi:hypothetical protein
MLALRCRGTVRAVYAKFARSNPKAPMKRAAESRFGLIADVGGDLTDRLTCHGQLPPS